MEFFGETLFPGQLGHFLIILSLIASGAATVCYFLSTQKKDISVKLMWRKLARIFFVAEAISVVTVFALLLYIISQHLFEYNYAYQHSSRALEMKYLFSSFWEGQEGSFLLWSFWHCMLGLIVIKKEKQWEAPVMAVVSFVQFCLATMVVGLNIFGLKIGTNPFVLLRNEMDVPIFSRPDYLSFVKDGNDLNPLLQNYWMVIHPPVLFLGFAATLFPFAFAIAGLWTRDYKGWTRPALPWSLFAAAALGLGIMMGAAWAYESLNFGGYWAWDPVENASLVPWLVLIGGVHTLLIFRHTGNALRSTFFFFIVSFLLILYSTYLTRSGDLQETSVHAFTGAGMTWQLRAFLLVFVIGSLVLFFKRYKEIPHIVKEEESSSREFWMFIGSLVFFLSAVSIIIMTSIPVINKFAGLFAGSGTTLFKPLAMGEDSALAYNRIQIFVAVILALLTAVTQYLKYKQTTPQFFLKKILYPTIASVVIAALILAFGNIDYYDNGIGYYIAVCLAIICSVYTIVANASYIWLGVNGKLWLSGASVAHVGFGLMLLGILLSSSKKELLSYNTSGIPVNFGKDSKEKTGENLTLVKGIRTDMGKYWVTYEKDSAHPEKPLWYYHLKFEDKNNGKTFTLTPNAFVNYKGNQGLMANPDAKHYIDHDIFTYITSLPDPEKSKEDTSKFRSETIKVGDTTFYSKGMIVLEDLNTKNNIPQAGFAPEDSATIGKLKILAKTGSVYTSNVLLISQTGLKDSYPDTVTAEGLVLQLQKLGNNEAEIGIKESDAVMQYVTLKAYKFPMINLLWLGTIIMVIGLLMSMAKRIRMNFRKI